MYGRFSWRNMPTPVPEGALPNTGLRNQHRRIRKRIAGGYPHHFPSVVNEFRAGIAWHENFFHGPLRGLELARESESKASPPPLTFPACPISRSPASPPSPRSSTRASQDMTYDFIDNVTFLKGRHSLEGRVQLQAPAGRQCLGIPIEVYGSDQFTGAFTGFAYSDFLLGIPQTTRRVTPRSRAYGRSTVYASGYLQDDFKIHPNLTLNLGLRYEWMNPFADKYDRMYNFDPRYRQPGCSHPDGPPAGREPNLPVFLLIRIVTADQAGFPPRGLRTPPITTTSTHGSEWRGGVPSAVLAA